MQLQKVLICNHTLYSNSILKTHLSSFQECTFAETLTLKELLNKISADAEKDIFWDFIFLDLELKDGNPILYIPKLQEVSPSSTIILTGGVSLTDENIAIALKSGVKHFLPKPYNSDYISHILTSTKNERGIMND